MANNTRVTVMMCYIQYAKSELLCFFTLGFFFNVVLNIFIKKFSVINLFHFRFCLMFNNNLLSNKYFIFIFWNCFYALLFIYIFMCVYFYFCALCSCCWRLPYLDTDKLCCNFFILFYFFGGVW